MKTSEMFLGNFSRTRVNSRLVSEGPGHHIDNCKMTYRYGRSHGVKNCCSCFLSFVVSNSLCLCPLSLIVKLNCNTVGPVPLLSGHSGDFENWPLNRGWPFNRGIILVVITDYWSAFDSLHSTQLRYGGPFPVRLNLTYFVRFTLYAAFPYCNYHHLYRIFEVSFPN